MTRKRWAYFALGAATGIGIGAVTNVVAQSVYPVRFDDSQPAVSSPVKGETPEGTPAALAPGSGASAITVEGEVLTVDSDNNPRLWGRGRPGTTVNLEMGGIPPILCKKDGLSFGLSGNAVDWGSAADACPAGFWVCTHSERGNASCDTFRPDTTVDGLDCSGEALDFSSSNHYAWIADAPGDNLLGTVAQENGAHRFLPTCSTLPVWCCTE